MSTVRIQQSIIHATIKYLYYMPSRSHFKFWIGVVLNIDAGPPVFEAPPPVQQNHALIHGWRAADPRLKIGGFPKIGVHPVITHFRLGFSIINHPLGHPPFMENLHFRKIMNKRHHKASKNKQETFQVLLGCMCTTASSKKLCSPASSTWEQHRKKCYLTTRGCKVPEAALTIFRICGLL